MAEGAMYQWKVQKVKNIPVVSYASIRKPLAPPRGKRWTFDKATKEWSLEDVPKYSNADVDCVVDAVLVDENGKLVNGEETSTTAVTVPFLEHLVRAIQDHTHRASSRKWLYREQYPFGS
jgi:hypothetical protein